MNKAVQQNIPHPKQRGRQHFAHWKPIRIATPIPTI